MHTNMLLLNNKKMSKSDGNTISPAELFSGNSSHTSRAYSPMVVRFFMLMAHYRSTLDITDDALLAAEKGYNKRMETNRLLQSLSVDAGAFDGSENEHDRAVLGLMEEAYKGMDDDFNTAMVIAALNEMGSYVHKIANKQLPADALSPWVLDKMKADFTTFLFDILGLLDDTSSAGDSGEVDGLMNLILEMRAQARAQKDWAASDKIRDTLAEIGIQVKDGKEGVTWGRSL
jgi:cysteinyl-tRNA synthetase